MNVAMIASGQPRFTKYLFDNFSRLKGASSIDLYFYIWKDYIIDEGELNIFDSIGSAEEQITKGLPTNCKIKKFVYAEEPTTQELFPKGFENLVSKTHGANQCFEEDILRKSLMNLYLQRYSSLQAFKLLDKNYDCVIRYRPDCFLSEDVNLKELNLEEFIYTPKNLTAGGAHIAGVAPFNDKFAIGNMKNMKIYFHAFDHLYENSLENKETIQEETSLLYHLHKNNVLISSTLKHYMVYIERGDNNTGMRKVLK